MVFGRKAPGVQTVVYRQVWAELYASIGINTAQVTAGVKTGVLQRKKREDCLWYSFRQESTGKSKWASNGANMTLPQSWTKFVVWRQSTFRLSPQNTMHWKLLRYLLCQGAWMPQRPKGTGRHSKPRSNFPGHRASRAPEAMEWSDPLGARQVSTGWSKSDQAGAKPALHQHLHSQFLLSH